MSITKKDIEKAAFRLDGVAKKTPLQKNHRLSKKYNSELSEKDMLYEYLV